MTTQAAIALAPRPPYAIIRPEVRRAKTDERDGAAEARLATRVAAGDPDALAEVYDRFGAVCFGFLVNTLRDRAAAEDVQQQVFLEVWQRSATYDPERGTLLTWIMTIARSRAIDHLRRRVPEPAGDLGATLETSAATDEIDELVERWRVAALIERLHPDEAAVLRMRFYDELPQTEIAERTGIPLGTVKMRMVSGLKRLRTMLEER
jgi:RNA polymerase sigma-70 factor, ECF subfamily